MEELRSAIQQAFHKGVYKVILSNPLSKAASYKKIVIHQKEQAENRSYQLEKYTETQVFHEFMDTRQVLCFLEASLGNQFRQCNSWDAQKEYSIRISSRGRVLSSQTPAKQAPLARLSHNREKNYILQEGAVIAPLVDMGIFTREGRVVKSMYDKYRQINRFIEIIDDEVAGLDLSKPLTIIDFGCGKSYLTFVLYYYFTEIKRAAVRMIGLDLKESVISQCSAAAEKYGYQGLSFELGDIRGYQCGFPVDMVITLHACDTATDHALFNAIQWEAGLIFSVPCCQHELNSQISSQRFSLLTRYGIIKEKTAALMTDAIRGGLLEYCGYQTQLLEFIDLAHTPKNILIRAKKGKPSPKKAALMLDEVKQLMDEFSLSPTLYALLEQGGFLCQDN